MQNRAKKLQKKTIIYNKQQRSKSHIFGLLLLQNSSHCEFRDTTPSPSHIMFTMLTHVFGRNGVLYQGDVQKNCHTDPKISKIIPKSEIFLLYSDDPLPGIKYKKIIPFAEIRK